MLVITALPSPTPRSTNHLSRSCFEVLTEEGVGSQHRGPDTPKLPDPMADIGSARYEQYGQGTEDERRCLQRAQRQEDLQHGEQCNQ